MSTFKLGLWQLALAVSTAAIPIMAQAQSYGAFNQDTIYGTLQKDQRDSFDQAVTNVLNDPQAHKVVQWNSETKGRSAAVSGQLQADDTHQQNGMPCRNLQAGLSRGTGHEKWDFLFCQTSDGQWKVASQKRQ